MTGVERQTRSRLKDPRLTIGMFARRALLSPKALRLYDRMGLLVPAEVDPDTGYRFYRESQLAEARLIARLRWLDMPLARVAEIMAAPLPERGAILAAYWDEVERRIAGQRDLMLHLLITLAGRERNFEMYEIHERDVDAQLVLTEQRHTTVDGLVSWMGDAFGRLHGEAARHGGATGAALAIYHGEVNEDSDGPVEICVPVAADAKDAASLPTRTEGPHREAYTRIRKSQVAYPQILDAYDAVEQWIGKHGKVIAGSPREVYFADFMNAGPDDEVVDIAFPIE